MPSLRLLAPALVSLALTGATAAPASASDFKGQAAGWGAVTATISDGTLTAFRMHTGRFASCDGQPDPGSAADPQQLDYAGAPVQLTGGAFHLEGTSVDDWGDQFHWTVDGTLSLDGREITGTGSASGDTVFEKGCVGTWSFDAIVPSSGPRSPVRRTFAAVAGRGGYDPGVSFDYRDGVITHLTAGVGVECADTSVYGANMDSGADGLDPIHVDRGGHFRVQGTVLDEYGAVNHYVIAGRIRGKQASGTVHATRDAPNGGAGRCTRDVTWRASAQRPPAPGPSAYFGVIPFRFGAPGAWSYYLVVKLNGCARAGKVQASVAGGPALTAGCHGQVRLGPLTPRRTYVTKVVPLALRGGRVTHRGRAVSTRVYLPGDDGNWIKILG